ncbi:MAG: hypothetical protein KKC51_09615 [Verrucomicrobia bacterium]|nr:hypothetical protein [Verrucomicrobiota bacterium]
MEERMGTSGLARPWMSRRLIPTSRIGRLVPACAGILFAVVSRGASPEFLADCQALTRHPHRLTGSEEYADAARHVEQRLRETGVPTVLVQSFPTVQNVVRRCEAVASDGRAFPLLPVRPNGVVPPATPVTGVTGRILHLGRGLPEDFDREDPRGRIVVMDYNSEDHWLKAFRLGARAVIFTREEPTDAFHFHYVRANANLPRFWYDGPASDLAGGLEVTIHSEVTWQRATGRNVFGFIPGTGPLFELGKEEVLVIAAPLDTYGEVPQRTPGGQPAANAAALLKLAGMLVQAPPRRHILLAFFDGHGRSHAGAAAFYQALETKARRATIEERMDAWEEESQFLTETEKLAAISNPFAERTADTGRELLLRMRNKAADHAYEIRGQLMDLREARSRTELGTPAYDDLLARENQLNEVYNGWNELRRQLGKGGAAAGGGVEFDAALADVRRDIALRRAELVEEEQMLRSSAVVKELLGDRWITLHATMMLGDRTPQWGVIVGGNSEIRSAQDQPGLYGRIQRSFLQAWRSLARGGRGASHFEPASVDGSLRDTRLLWAAPLLVHGGEMAGRYGIYNIVLGTLHETLPRLGTPDDTLDRLNLDLVEQNTEEVALLLAAVGSLQGASGDVEAVADQRGLSLRRAIMADNDYLVSGFSGGRTQGALVMGRHRGSSIPNRPVPGAVVQVSLVDPWNSVFWRHDKVPGFEPFTVVMTDQNGAYSLNALPTQDPVPIGFAAAFDDRGLVTQVSDMASRKTVRQRLNMLRCVGGVLVLPPMHWTQKATFMSSRANAPLAPPTAADSYGETTDGVAYWYGEEKLPGIKAFGLDAIVALVNGEVEGQPVTGPYGRGYPMTTDWLTLRNAEGSAWDLWRLNEARLSILRSRDILNSALEEAHGRVRDLLDEAAGSDSLVRGEALCASAFLGALPVYTQVRTSMDDLVKAVLVLLALCIPFAFALERLLIGATLIFKQVAWFVAFFIATFLLLYVSHPAFAIAQTPIIIFLGFAVVVLSGLVIVIIMQKFQLELKRMQGMTATVHASDISRFSTVMAAMSMGISTMRRRPLRTTLTAVTIILLTFTILGFASFDTQRGIVKLFVAPAPPYTGVMLNNPTWGSFNAEFVDLVQSRWSREVNVCLRHWICPEFKDDPDFVIALEDGSKPVSLKAVLGISAEEVAARPDLQALFQLKDPADLDRMVLMTDAVAKLLKVKPGDRVCLKGTTLEVGPLLSAAELSAARDMEGSSILPVDFATMKLASAGTEEVGENVLDEQAKWTSLPVDSIVITSSETARQYGGKPHLIHLYTRDAQEAAGIAEDLARMLDRHPVMATRMDGVYRHVQGTVMAASGVGDLFFPILLGGLVIFGTMLGSVADREKEIYTFSALGLAPPHVASLFFSEAMVYSVIGGLGGYLIAQGTLKVLTVAAEFGLVRVPEMNYSSTNAIVTILIVMATVLISAIYPAMKASRSANPGLMRLWKLPPPEGDVFNIVFPFTVSAYDLTGVVSFLKEHFSNFGDVGLGRFMARQPVVRAYEDGSLGLTAQLALAPFDLGVTQWFELRSAPSEIEGIDEVNIRLTRRSGQPKDWARLNRVLLNDLRTQFLLWRSLPQETMEQYRQRTLTTMGRVPVMEGEPPASRKDDADGGNPS